mgnify:CR=1 FL=1
MMTLMMKKLAMVTATNMITSMMRTANMIIIIMVMAVNRDDIIVMIVDKLDDLDQEEDITGKKEEAKKE